MTLAELIQRLQEVEEAIGGDAEVRLLIQPNYPLSLSVAGVVSYREVELEEDEEPETPTVWILQGDEEEYGPSAPWYLT